MRFGKYFVEWYDEENEDASEIFETENEMFNYLKKNGIKKNRRKNGKNQSGQIL